MVVGGGLIGLKAAEALNDIGISVTVVELMDRILSLAFDKTAGDLMKKRLEKAGITVITGDSVTAVTADGRRRIGGDAWLGRDDRYRRAGGGRRGKAGYGACRGGRHQGQPGHPR